MSRGVAMAFILGQVSPVVPQGEWWSPLVNAGAMGVILFWFMWQFSKKEDERIAAQREVAKAINSNTQGMMVVVLSLKNVDEHIREMAKKIADDSKT